MELARVLIEAVAAHAVRWKEAAELIQALETFFMLSATKGG
jgi:hypothetical protein